MGISYFWFLGAFLQMVLPLFGKEILQLGETRIGLLWTFAAVGIGAGSLAAGRLSGDKIELGLVPLGSVGMGAFSVLLFLSQPSFDLAAICLVLIGFAAGFFAVPLNALLQQRSGREDKGRLIATNNVFNTIGVLLASAMLWGLATLAPFTRGSNHSDSGTPDFCLDALCPIPLARLLRSLHPLATHPHFISHSNRRAGEHSAQRSSACWFLITLPSLMRF